MATKLKVKKKPKSKQNLWVFWNYDCFPYLLGAKLIDLDSEGFALTENYGGMRFKPAFFISERAGYELKKELNLLEATYNKEKSKLFNTFKERKDELLVKFNVGR